MRMVAGRALGAASLRLLPKAAALRPLVNASGPTRLRVPGSWRCSAQRAGGTACNCTAPAPGSPAEAQQPEGARVQGPQLAGQAQGSSCDACAAVAQEQEAQSSRSVFVCRQPINKALVPVHAVLQSAAVSSHPLPGETSGGSGAGVAAAERMQGGFKGLQLICDDCKPGIGAACDASAAGQLQRAHTMALASWSDAYQQVRLWTQAWHAAGRPEVAAVAADVHRAFDMVRTCRAAAQHGRHASSRCVHWPKHKLA